MELTTSLKELLIDTAKSLKGSARRVFIAGTVKELGKGGQKADKGVPNGNWAGIE